MGYGYYIRIIILSFDIKIGDFPIGVLIDYLSVMSVLFDYLFKSVCVAHNIISVFLVYILCVDIVILLHNLNVI